MKLAGINSGKQASRSASDILFSCTCQKLIHYSMILLQIALVIVFFHGRAEALSNLSRVTSRYFLLRGDMTVSYERNWSEDVSRDRLLHEYNLSLSGFVVDPRLVLFEVSGLFSQELNNPGDTYTSYRVGTEFSFLNTQVLRGPLQHFPQPIHLNFDYYKANFVKSLSYGLNLTYAKPGMGIAFFRGGKIIALERWLPQGANAGNLGTNNNSGNSNSNSNNSNSNAGAARAQQGGLLIPFPTFYLDYDGFSSIREPDGDEQKRQRLSFRGEAFTRTSRYRLEYRSTTISYTGSNASTESKDQLLDVYADYHFPDKKANTLLDIYNQFSYRKYQESSYMSLSSRGIWLKRLGPDLRDILSVSGNARYFTAETSSGYSGAVSGTYARNYSERLRNTLTATIGYDSLKDDSVRVFSSEVNDNTYSVGINDSLTYELSRRITLSGNLQAGINNDRQTYGASAGITTRTRPAISAGYAYAHSDTGAGFLDTSRDTHQFNLDLRTILPGNIYLFSRNRYIMIDMQAGDKETRMYLRADMYKNYYDYRFNLGASYLSMDRLGSRKAESVTTLVHASVARFFSRKLFVAARISYAVSNNDVSTLEFDPSLTWIYRRISVSAHYTLRRSELGQSVTRLDHRLYLSFKRDFNQRLRPFL